MGNIVSQYIVQKRDSMYFVSNMPGCPRITPIFPTFIARNRNFIEQPLSYFSTFRNTFYNTQLAFTFHLLSDFHRVHNHILFYGFFLLQ